MSSEEIKAKLNDINSILGYGAQGVVIKITTHTKKEVFALKQVKISNADDLSSFEKEFKLSQLGIPNVLKSFGSYFDSASTTLEFTTELMETDLFKFMKEKKKSSLSFSEFIPIFSDIIQGIFHFFFF